MKYNDLYYQLSPEHREMISSTASYLDFYRLVGFYLFIYALLNATQLAGNALRTKTFWTAISSTSPMLGGWEANTILLLLLALGLSYVCFRGFLIQYDTLFLPDGHYATLAEQYHREKGRLAASLWGRVLTKSGPTSGFRVRVLDDHGDLLEQTETNNNGQFQFPNLFESCLNKTCEIRVRANGTKGRIVFRLTEKQVPHFEIDLV